MEPSSKRRRRNAERCSRCAKRRHLYLALDDWNGGYSIHKLDPDDMETDDADDHLPDPAAVRVPAPECGPMAFTALGTTIFIATNPNCNRGRAPPTLAYDTATASLTVGPRLPDGQLRDLGGGAMAAGDKLYALTSLWDDAESSFSALLEVLSWSRNPHGQQDLWDPSMTWSWTRGPSPPPYTAPHQITAHALHPDGKTIFVSTDWHTDAFDSGAGEWRELGDWALPFRGQAFFDADLDAWVGLHRGEEGRVCCCPVASRSAAADRPPECRVLREKLVRRTEEDPEHWGCLRGKDVTLTYMGDSRYCLVENVLRSEDGLDAVIHVTLFGLKYDEKGELTTMVWRTTRSYEVSKNTRQFSHAVFWM